MKRLIYFGISIPLCLLILATCGGVVQKDSPFGVCMHLQDGEEHIKIPENIRLVRDAGIVNIRADFSWGAVERSQGVWRFDNHDRVVKETEKMGLQLLGLLLYNVPWANPAYKHLDAWLTYVEKMVTRYKDKVRYWEVWNEPNLYPMFWSQYDDPENYALLLKATYQKIKEIDPNIVVVHAGTAGIPLKYIEKSFEAGAHLAFDKMAVHPYRPLLNSWETTLAYKDDLDGLFALMEKYQIAHKGVWLTEMGYTSMTAVKTGNKDVFHKIKAETGKDWKVAVVCDDDYPVDPSFTAKTLRSFFPSGFRLDTVQIFDMRRIRLHTYDAVFIPPSDNTPLHVSKMLTEYLTNYLKGGGKVFYYSGNGSMFYYDDAVTKETEQANFLAQSMWLSLRFGVEKYFWYELESPGHNMFDREANFGLTNEHLSPKPAYHAYSTIGRLFPEGSTLDTSIEWRQKDCCVVSWKQPDGTRLWAVWSPEGPQTVDVKIGKGLRQAFHILGSSLADVTESSTTLDVGREIVYLAGPETFEIL